MTSSVTERRLNSLYFIRLTFFYWSFGMRQRCGCPGCQRSFYASNLMKETKEKRKKSQWLWLRADAWVRQWLVSFLVACCAGKLISERTNRLRLSGSCFFWVVAFLIIDLSAAGIGGFKAFSSSFSFFLFLPTGFGVSPSLSSGPLHSKKS